MPWEPLKTVQVYSQMIKVGLEVDMANVVEVLSATVTEIQRNMIKIRKPGPIDDVDVLQVWKMKIFLVYVPMHGGFIETHVYPEECLHMVGWKWPVMFSQVFVFTTNWARQRPKLAKLS